MSRFFHWFEGSELSAKEQTLLADTVGAGSYRVLTRWPLTVAFGAHAWLPALGGAVCGFALADRQGLWFGLAAAAVAGAAQMVSLAVHEAGHLLSSRVARGVSPRMLLMRSSGGVAIVEGRFKKPREAAIFAAGGPIATVLLTIVLVLAGRSGTGRSELRAARRGFSERPDPGRQPATRGAHRRLCPLPVGRLGRIGSRAEAERRAHRLEPCRARVGPLGCAPRPRRRQALRRACARDADHAYGAAPYGGARGRSKTSLIREVRPARRPALNE